MKENRNLKRGLIGLVFLVAALAGIGVWIGMSIGWEFAFSRRILSGGLI